MVQKNRPFVIGVTGAIATGKSTVLAMLAELGADTIDADRLYHELIAPGTPLNTALADRFGAGIVAPDGTIDRRALGVIVFSDPTALQDLDRITHPAVISAARDRIASSAAAVVAIDAVKLVESGMDALCDRVWVVTCDDASQLARLQARNALSIDEARRRIAAQPPLEPKLARADLVIDNSGDRESTRAQVAVAWARLPILHL